MAKEVFHFVAFAGCLTIVFSWQRTDRAIYRKKSNKSDNNEQDFSTPDKGKNANGGSGQRCLSD